VDETSSTLAGLGNARSGARSEGRDAYFGVDRNCVNTAQGAHCCATNLYIEPGDAMRSVLTRSLLAMVAAGSVIIAAGCGGSGSNPGANSPASGSSSAQAANGQEPKQAPPHGFQWVGNSSQGIWVAVPKSWVAIDLSRLTVRQALHTLKGVSSATMRADLKTLKQHKALFVADLNSASASAHHFATNVNAFCNSEAIQPGPGAASIFDKALRNEYNTIHAHVVSLKNTQVSSTAVVIQTKLTLQATAGYTLTELQTANITNHSKICEVTLSTDNPHKYLRVLKRIQRTVITH